MSKMEELESLSPARLIIVCGEPFPGGLKKWMLSRVILDLKLWDTAAAKCDLNDELKHFENKAPTKKIELNGEETLFYTSNVLHVEIEKNVYVKTLADRLMAIRCERRRIPFVLVVFWGIVVQSCSDVSFPKYSRWPLRDGLFDANGFTDFDLNNDFHLTALAVYGDSTAIPSVPNELSHKHDGLYAFLFSQLKFLDVSLSELLPPPAPKGPYYFHHPTLYVFPTGPSISSFLGLEEFTMLVDGGYSHHVASWELIRHLEKLDVLLITAYEQYNMFGIRAMLGRMLMKDAHSPKIGCALMNHAERQLEDNIIGWELEMEREQEFKLEERPHFKTECNPAAEVMAALQELKALNVDPKPCSDLKNQNHVCLYRKVGVGSLCMDVFQPTVKGHLKDYPEGLEAGSVADDKKTGSPFSALTSICAMVKWSPASPAGKVTRILFTGSAHQDTIFEGLARWKDNETPVCPNGVDAGHAKVFMTEEDIGRLSNAEKDTILKAHNNLNADNILMKQVAAKENAKHHHKAKQGNNGGNSGNAKGNKFTKHSIDGSATCTADARVDSSNKLNAGSKIDGSTKCSAGPQALLNAKSDGLDASTKQRAKKKGNIKRYAASQLPVGARCDNGAKVLSRIDPEAKNDLPERKTNNHCRENAVHIERTSDTLCVESNDTKESDETDVKQSVVAGGEGTTCDNEAFSNSLSAEFKGVAISDDIDASDSHLTELLGNEQRLSKDESFCSLDKTCKSEKDGEETLLKLVGEDDSDAAFDAKHENLTLVDLIHTDIVTGYMQEQKSVESSRLTEGRKVSCSARSSTSIISCGVKKEAENKIPEPKSCKEKWNNEEVSEPCQDEVQVAAEHTNFLSSAARKSLAFDDCIVSCQLAKSEKESKSLPSESNDATCLVLDCDVESLIVLPRNCGTNSAVPESKEEFQAICSEENNMNCQVTKSRDKYLVISPEGNGASSPASKSDESQVILPAEENVNLMNRVSESDKLILPTVHPASSPGANNTMVLPPVNLDQIEESLTGLPSKNYTNCPVISCQESAVLIPSREGEKNELPSVCEHVVCSLEEEGEKSGPVKTPAKNSVLIPPREEDHMDSYEGTPVLILLQNSDNSYEAPLSDIIACEDAMKNGQALKCVVSLSEKNENLIIKGAFDQPDADLDRVDSLENLQTTDPLHDKAPDIVGEDAFDFRDMLQCDAWPINPFFGMREEATREESFSPGEDKLAEKITRNRLQDVDQDSLEEEDFNPEQEWNVPMNLPEPDVPGNRKNSDNSANNKDKKGNDAVGVDSTYKLAPGETRKGTTEKTAGAKCASVSTYSNNNSSKRKGGAKHGPIPGENESKLEPGAALKLITRTTNVSRSQKIFMDYRKGSTSGKKPEIQPQRTFCRKIKKVSSSLTQAAKSPTKVINEPVYMDVTFIPHGGDQRYVNELFFKIIRSRFYVLSSNYDDLQVLDRLLEAKETWKDETKVSIIPTHDTKLLNDWKTSHIYDLSRLKVDVKPAADKCKVNLWGENEDFSAFQLEFGS